MLLDCVRLQINLTDCHLNPEHRSVPCLSRRTEEMLLMIRCRLFMYVYYSEEEADAEIHGRRSSIGGPERTFRRARRAFHVLIGASSFALFILLISAAILHWFGRVGEIWANILGVAVAVFACVQWVPQVVTSWHLGHLGSLSLTSLCISAPVCILDRDFRMPSSGC